MFPERITDLPLAAAAAEQGWELWRQWHEAEEYIDDDGEVETFKAGWFYFVVKHDGQFFQNVSVSEDEAEADDSPVWALIFALGDAELERMKATVGMGRN